MDPEVEARFKSLERRVDVVEDATSSQKRDLSKMVEGWGRLFVEVTALTSQQARIEKKLDVILQHLGVPKP